MIHQAWLYHTPNMAVSNAEHGNIMHPTWLCHTPHMAVSYTKRGCTIHQTWLYHTLNMAVSYTKYGYIIHHTWLYHTPNMAMPQTWPYNTTMFDQIRTGEATHYSHAYSFRGKDACEGLICAIHQTSLYHTPDTTVSYTRHQVSFVLVCCLVLTPSCLVYDQVVCDMRYCGVSGV